MNKKPTYNVSIRCAYPNGNRTEHRQELKLGDIPKWIEAYTFTHPDVYSISIKVWMKDGREGAESEGFRLY